MFPLRPVSWGFRTTARRKQQTTAPPAGAHAPPRHAGNKSSTILLRYERRFGGDRASSPPRHPWPPSRVAHHRTNRGTHGQNHGEAPQGQRQLGWVYVRHLIILIPAEARANKTFISSSMTRRLFFSTSACFYLFWSNTTRVFTEENTMLVFVHHALTHTHTHVSETYVSECLEASAHRKHSQGLETAWQRLSRWPLLWWSSAWNYVMLHRFIAGHDPPHPRLHPNHYCRRHYHLHHYGYVDCPLVTSYTGL